MTTKQVESTRQHLPAIKESSSVPRFSEVPAATLAGITRPATRSPGTATVQDACLRADLEGYLSQQGPILDQAAILAREATALQSLNPERAIEMLVDIQELQTKLTAFTPPLCLVQVQQSASSALAWLENALQFIVNGDFAQAEPALMESFTLLADSAARLAMLNLDLKAISTPRP